jgi:hypothetical protein
VTALYVLDVPEHTALAKVAALDPEVTVGRIGPYFEIMADGPDHPARQERPAGRPSVSRSATERLSVSVPATERLGAGRYLAAGERPEATHTSVHELTTADGATVRGVLATVPGATTVVCLMHPRQDLTHHPLVPLLLRAGAAVWTQYTRSVNNDLALVDEQAILDVAAGLVFLRYHPAWLP